MLSIDLLYVNFSRNRNQKENLTSILIVEVINTFKQYNSCNKLNKKKVFLFKSYSIDLPKDLGTRLMPAPLDTIKILFVGLIWHLLFILELIHTQFLSWTQKFSKLWVVQSAAFVTLMIWDWIKTEFNTRHRQINIR